MNNQKKSIQHKVLVFGDKVFGSDKPEISVEYADVDFIQFPDEYSDLPGLSDYDLVLLDYSAFLGEIDHYSPNVYSTQQEIFEKQMLGALDRGTSFCILHYDENVPIADKYNYQNGMDEDDIKKCNRSQIGFRWLYRFDIRPYRADNPILNSMPIRSEFKPFQDRWGASKNYFRPFQDGEFNDVIVPMSEGFALGFSLSYRRGKLIYMPCQRDYNRPHSIAESLRVLINGLITYMSRSSIEVPEWGQGSLFSQEAILDAKLAELNSEVEKLIESLDLYRKAKGLAFLREYHFEDAVPRFFISHFGIQTERNEKYKEDFWILDDEGEKIVIAETKSRSRGMKKSVIYSIYNHREANELDESFPALLVINAHLNANSWKGKIRPIAPQEYKVAVSHNILIARIEDLLFAWDAISEGQISKDELIKVFISENGWLEVGKEGNLIIHKK
jgi:hypothetical protein